MFFNRFKSIPAKDVDLGHVFIVNGQKYVVRSTGSNDTHKWIWTVLADNSSDRVLELKFKLDTIVHIKTK